MNADPPFCLNARVPCTPAFSRPCPSGAGYARSLDNAYVPGELSPGSRADSARSARQYVKHKPCPNGVDNALIFQKNFWSSKMRDFRPRTSPKMTKNTLFYIVEDDRAHLRHVLPAGFKRLRHYGLLACGHKRARLAAARAALQTPAPQATVIEAAEHFLARVSGEDPRCCPHCGIGRWHTVEIVMARRYDPPALAPRCRDGPP